MAWVVAPLTTTVMNSVNQSEAGTASGINNSVSRIASLLSVAIGGAILLQLFGDSLQKNLAETGIPAVERQKIYQQRNNLSQIEIPRTLDAGQNEQVRSDIAKSALAAFRGVALLSAVLAALGVLVAWLTFDRWPEQVVPNGQPATQKSI
jgi:hypothetical protein